MRRPFRFAYLGSGSRGNALVVTVDTTCILVDCGFSVKETVHRLQRLGIEPEAVDAVLVTHEHRDHIGGVGPFARRFGVPVWMTPGSFSGQDADGFPRVELFNCHEPFAVGDLEVWPYPVPHDAREPAQFVFGDGSVRLGLLTDAGRPTQHIADQLQGCDALIVECNHDPEMLANGPYPPALKARVGGGLGHLSNGQAAQVVSDLSGGTLQHVVAAHLSEKNNRPELAQAALSDVLGCTPDWIAWAEQDTGLDWREVN